MWPLSSSKKPLSSAPPPPPAAAAAAPPEIVVKRPRRLLSASDFCTTLRILNGQDAATPDGSVDGADATSVLTALLEELQAGQRDFIEGFHSYGGLSTLAATLQSGAEDLSVLSLCVDCVNALMDVPDDLDAVLACGDLVSALACAFVYAGGAGEDTLDDVRTLLRLRTTVVRVLTALCAESEDDVVLAGWEEARLVTGEPHRYATLVDALAEVDEDYGVHVGVETWALKASIVAHLNALLNEDSLEARMEVRSELILAGVTESLEPLTSMARERLAALPEGSDSKLVTALRFLAANSDAFYVNMSRDDAASSTQAGDVDVSSPDAMFKQVQIYALQHGHVHFLSSILQHLLCVPSTLAYGRDVWQRMERAVHEVIMGVSGDAGRGQLTYSDMGVMLDLQQQVTELTAQLAQARKAAIAPPGAPTVPPKRETLLVDDARLREMQDANRALSSMNNALSAEVERARVDLAQMREQVDAAARAAAAAVPAPAPAAVDAAEVAALRTQVHTLQAALTLAQTQAATPITTQAASTASPAPGPARPMPTAPGAPAPIARPRPVAAPAGPAGAGDARPARPAGGPGGARPGRPIAGGAAAAAAPPQPRGKPAKPVPVPGVKLRALYWTKIPDQSVDATVWKDLSDERVSINTAELEAQFKSETAATARPAAAPAAAPEATSAGTPSSPVQTRPKGPTLLLDGKRQQNAGIALARVRMRAPAIRAAVCDGDMNSLTQDRVTLLQNMVPTQDELHMLSEYEGDRSLLGSVEQFFLCMAGVTFYDKRLQAMQFVHSHARLCEDTSNRARRLRNACDCVRNCTSLRAMLEYLLCIGNYLNAGNSARGGAWGFKLDALSKMSGLKSADGRSTLMDYVAALAHTDAQARARGLARVHTDMAAIVQARLDSVDAMCVDAKGMDAQLTALSQLLRDCDGEQVPDVDESGAAITRAGKFAANMEPHARTCMEHVTAVVKEALDVQVLFKDTLSAYSVDTCDSTEFFGVFAEFMQSYKAACDRYLRAHAPAPAPAPARVTAATPSAAPAAAPAKPQTGVVGALFETLENAAAESHIGLNRVMHTHRRASVRPRSINLTAAMAASKAAEAGQRLNAPPTGAPPPMAMRIMAGGSHDGDADAAALTRVTAAGRARASMYRSLAGADVVTARGLSSDSGDDSVRTLQPRPPAYKKKRAAAAAARSAVASIEE